MADAEIMQIAAAVVTTLNDGTFSEAFTAAGAYRPTYELPDMGAVHVTVVPRSLAETPLSRSTDRHDYTIDVAVQKRLDAATEVDAQVGALMLLVGEVRDYMRRRPLAGMASAHWIGTENAPIFEPDHLAEWRQFTSVLSLSYRVLR